MKCNRCGKEFVYGNRPDGNPNGIGIAMRNGKIYHLCADCIIETGKNPKIADEVKADIARLESWN